MRWSTRQLEVPVTEGADGADVPCDGGLARSVQVAGYESGAWELHGTVDGTNYDVLVSSLNDDGINDAGPAVARVRLHCTTAPDANLPAGPPDDPPTVTVGWLTIRD